MIMLKVIIWYTFQIALPESNDVLKMSACVFTESNDVIKMSAFVFPEGEPLANRSTRLYKSPLKVKKIVMSLVHKVRETQPLHSHFALTISTMVNVVFK